MTGGGQPLKTEAKAAVVDEAKSKASDSKTVETTTASAAGDGSLQTSHPGAKSSGPDRGRGGGRDGGDRGRRGRGAFRGRGQDRRGGGFHNRNDRSLERDGQGSGNSNNNNQRNMSFRDRFSRDGYNDQDGGYNEMIDESSQQPREEKKFTGRCRLFVGNLTPDLDEEAFKKMFLEYGDVSEVYLNSQKGFGFIRLDTRHNAEKAKMKLDGVMRKGRTLRVRFATHGAALKVRYLSPFVTNELLEEAFSRFGQVERAIVIVDDRGKPCGDGIVEFARKPGAQKAMVQVNENVFLLGSSPRPIIVEPLDQKDEEDGLPDKYITKNAQYTKEREQAARFAKPESFEYKFGMRWMQLYDMERKEKERLQKEMIDAVDKLEIEMGNAMHEQQANLLRQELQRLEDMRAAEEMKRRELAIRRQEEERIRREEEEAQRQQRIMRQQKHEEQYRRRQIQPNMGRPDMMDDRQMFESRGGRGVSGLGGRDGLREAIRDVRDGRDMPREIPRDSGQNSTSRDMQPEMGGHEMHRSDQDRGNAPPMQPPPAPPAGFNINRERNQDMMGMSGLGSSPGTSADYNHGNSSSGSSMAMRQSRFDQPPSGYGNQRQMGGMGNVGGNMGGSMMGNVGGNMRNNERMMDRRDRRDDYDSKRPRRY